MTESLINTLSHMSPLLVKARSSVFRYKGKEIEPQKVAGELSVEAILNGRVVQRGDDERSLGIIELSFGGKAEPFRRVLRHSRLLQLVTVALRLFALSFATAALGL
jgi:hypothetical protein